MLSLEQCGLMDDFRKTFAENTTETYCLYDARLRFYLSTILHMNPKDITMIGEGDFAVCKLDAYIAQCYDEWLCSLFN